jgi:hypothetical protein
MMSKKCKYALKALVRLSGEFGGGHLLTDDIARAENIPKKFLEQILLDLTHAGDVRSKQKIITLFNPIRFLTNLIDLLIYKIHRANR